MIGWLVGWLVRLWSRTWRVTVVSRTSDAVPCSPRVFAFWHGQQMALTAVSRRRPTAVMVSWSKDGSLQARVMAALGLTVVRGSTSRGGARALHALVRLARRGHDLAFAADGPRGPLRIAKTGASLAAALSHGELLPVGSAAAPSVRLTGAWDRFEIPLPFARVVIAIGEKLTNMPSEAGELSAAIEAARQHAVAHLRGQSTTRDPTKSGTRMSACPPS